MPQEFYNLDSVQHLNLIVPRYIYNSNDNINKDIECFPDISSINEVISSCDFETEQIDSAV